MNSTRLVRLINAKNVSSTRTNRFLSLISSNEKFLNSSLLGDLWEEISGNAWLFYPFVASTDPSHNASNWLEGSADPWLLFDAMPDYRYLLENLPAANANGQCWYNTGLSATTLSHDVSSPRRTEWPAKTKEKHIIRSCLEIICYRRQPHCCRSFFLEKENGTLVLPWAEIDGAMFPPISPNGWVHRVD